MIATTPANETNLVSPELASGVLHSSLANEKRCGSRGPATHAGKGMAAPNSIKAGDRKLQPAVVVGELESCGPQEACGELRKDNLPG